MVLVLLVLALLKDDVTDQRLVFTIGRFRVYECHFVEDWAEAFYLNAHWTAYFGPDGFLSSSFTFYFGNPLSSIPAFLIKF